LQFALPVLKHHGCPATIYVTSDFASGQGNLWWLVVEEAVRRMPRIEIGTGRGRIAFDTSTTSSKQRAFTALVHRLIGGDEPSRSPLVASLAADGGFAPEAVCRDQCLSWDELETLAEEPLITIGAHTRSHPILSKLEPSDAFEEIAEGRRMIASRLGRPPEHFAYPIGKSGMAGPREFAMIRNLGFKTGVTTRRGLLHARHGDALSHLPRVSLNGHLQEARYVDLLLSGAPFLLTRPFRPAG
jgi:peptidoglycan/xylan/chitin deacetylase (PgdA/CDA1 family)